MAGFSITGMASGLPPNIVEQLIEAERIPVKNIESKKVKLEDTQKLVTDLETKINDITGNLGELLTVRGFSDLQLASSDENVVGGSVDPDAVIPGEYGITVEQLATKPGAISNGFKDRNSTQIGVGYIKFNTEDGTKEVYINPKNSTLEGISAQINNSPYGLRSTILEDRSDKERPFRLLVTGIATGDDKQISFPTIYMLDGDRDFYFDQKREAQNAKVKVDGFEIEIPGNQTDKIIPGVSLDFKQAMPGKEIRINVKENLEAISGKVKSFVDAYNATLGFIQGQHKLSKDSSGRERLGPLGGDSILRRVENSLRRVIQNPQLGLGSEITRLNQLGIEFTRSGTLNFNTEKFNKVLNGNPKAVSAFLRGDGFATGFVPTLKREVGYLLNPQTGVIANRKKSLSDRIGRMNQSIDTKERQLAKREEGLRKKFADLESKMAGLQKQGAALGAMSAGAPGAQGG